MRLILAVVEPEDKSHVTARVSPPGVRAASRRHRSLAYMLSSRRLRGPEGALDPLRGSLNLPRGVCQRGSCSLRSQRTGWPLQLPPRRGVLGRGPCPHCVSPSPTAGCKIKALRAKTNTYIKTPHFSVIRATRSKAGGLPGTAQGPPNLPGQTTI
ncbi:hypothetical protein E2I00_006615, partial [Balaenoptera physalus]